MEINIQLSLPTLYVSSNSTIGYDYKSWVMDQLISIILIQYWLEHEDTVWSKQRHAELFKVSTLNFISKLYSVYTAILLKLWKPLPLPILTRDTAIISSYIILKTAKNDMHMAITCNKPLRYDWLKQFGSLCCG